MDYVLNLHLVQREIPSLLQATMLMLAKLGGLED